MQHDLQMILMRQDGTWKMKNYGKNMTLQKKSFRLLCVAIKRRNEMHMWIASQLSGQTKVHRFMLLCENMDGDHDNDDDDYDSETDGGEYSSGESDPEDHMIKQDN